MATTTSKTRLVRSLRGGQMTIPIEFRRALGIDEETMLRVTLVDGELRIIPLNLSDDESEQGSPWLLKLYEYYAPVREEILARGIPEEEVNADIDAAIAAVRAEQRANRE
jgi:bifunctional DNA-binding transcriptional regulator/antitoxin component of YhaV-PrlF toxin-antitoxin module